MRFGLLVFRPVCMYFVGLCAIAAEVPVSAQSADALAIPVRKNASDSTDKESAQSKPADADLAVVRNLRENSSFYTLQPSDIPPRKSDSDSSSRSSKSSDSSEKSSGSTKDSENKSASARTSDQAERNDGPTEDRGARDDQAPARKVAEADSDNTSADTRAAADARSAAEPPARADTDAALAAESFPVRPRMEMASAQPVATPAVSSAIAAPAPTRRAALTPNLYISQPQEKESFLSRLFNRKKSNPAPRQAQPYFNSDYATRDDNVILPTALRGNGYFGEDLPIGGEDPYRLASLPASFRPTDLTKLPVQLCHYGNQLYLRREAAASLCTMINAAAREGLTIRVVSAFRDIGHQTRLYNKAVARGGLDQKSVARPGRSEHNLGTTVDLTNNEQHCLKRSFGNTPEGRWLAANAGRFGWKLTVMSSNARRSHNDEPWHLRYLGSAIDGTTPISTIAQSNSRPQRRDVFGSIGRFLGLRD